VDNFLKLTGKILPVKTGKKSPILYKKKNQNKNKQFRERFKNFCG